MEQLSGFLKKVGDQAADWGLIIKFLWGRDCGH